MRIDHSRAYRHGMRVRIGPGRAAGVLWECERRDGTGIYWKVRTQTGGWLYPDDSLIVDGPGDDVGICGSCELPFLRPAESGEVLCAQCHYEQFGPHRRPDDAPPSPPWRGRRMRHF